DLLDRQAERPVWQGVGLEIRCPAYLCGLRATAEPTESGWQIEVHGAVVRDEPGDALEVYALIDGTNQGHQQIQTEEPVCPVRFMLPWENKSDATELWVRVDLVNVSTIWHTAECV